MEILFRM